MKVTALFVCLAIFPMIVSSQIPNNGFENWTDMGAYNNPDDWSTLNDVTAPENVFTCTKGSPGNPGTSYIKLTSKNISEMGLKPGLAVSGILDTIALLPVSGFPFTGRPESLGGNWQYMAFGNDQGFISILLSKWNENDQMRDTISYTYYSLPGMVMSWDEFTITLEYQKTDFPDSAIIVLSASNANGAQTANNSYLYIDDLEFNNIITSVSNLNSQSPAFLFYPNPASTKIFFRPNENINKVDIELFDMVGKSWLRKEQVNLSQDLSLDISMLPRGAYLLKVISGISIRTEKLTIE
jgi:hypothetical protein